MCITFKLESLIATELTEKETLNITDSIPTRKRESLYQNFKNYFSLTGLTLTIINNNKIYVYQQKRFTTERTCNWIFAIQIPL